MHLKQHKNCAFSGFRIHIFRWADFQATKVLPRKTLSAMALKFKTEARIDPPVSISSKISFANSKSYLRSGGAALAVKQ